MTKLLVCLLGLFFAAQVSTALTLACLNDYSEYAVDHRAVAKSRSVVEELTNVELIEPWTVRRDRLRREADAGGDYKVRNDLASALIHTGDLRTAIQILEEIEKTNPGLYRTASNLGTAYELAGEPAKALDWIRKGIDRNPESHEGSEWIHVRILEKKVSGTKVSSWENDGSLLGLSFSNTQFPTKPTVLPTGNAGKPLTLEQVEEGLKYQLHERLQFVKPPDLIVASLLFDLGNLIALKPEGIGMAQGTYELAAKYAQSSTPDKQDIGVLIEDRRSTAEAFNKKRVWSPSLFQVILAVWIAVYVLKKVRKRMRMRNTGIAEQA